MSPNESCPRLFISFLLHACSLAAPSLGTAPPSKHQDIDPDTSLPPPLINYQIVNANFSNVSSTCPCLSIPIASITIQAINPCCQVAVFKYCPLCLGIPSHFALPLLPIILSKCESDHILHSSLQWLPSTLFSDCLQNSLDLAPGLPLFASSFSLTVPPIIWNYFSVLQNALFT